MLFKYHAIDQDSHEREGTVEAPSQDVAVAALQRRGLIISSIESTEKSSLKVELPFFGRVSNKDIVIFSRQVATLFEAQVSALRAFRLLSAEAENKKLAAVLATVGDDIQGGSSLSKALARHPKIFSAFYVNMVNAGEESGKLAETFVYLADYLDRSYELVSKAENALVYPAFVITVFFGVMGLMLALVIPKISAVLIDSGQEIPIYTKIVIGLSNLIVHYGIFFIIVLIAGGFYLWQLKKTEKGKFVFDGLKLQIPYVGDLYRKLYLSRIADNFSTMLLSESQLSKLLRLRVRLSTIVSIRGYLLGVVADEREFPSPILSPSTQRFQALWSR